MRSIIVLALCFVWSFAHADVAASDADKAKAKDLSKLAFQRASADGDFLGAMDLFLEAFELGHDPQDLLNAGIAARKAPLPQQAVDTYRRYLALDTAPEQMRTQLLAEIEVIKAASATITVTTGGAAAAISLDARFVGSASKDVPLVVLANPGAGVEHALVAKRVGFGDALEKMAGLKPGEARAVVLEPKIVRTTAKLSLSSLPTGAKLDSLTPGLVLTTSLPHVIELPAGDYELVARHAGYDDKSESIHVDAGVDREIVFTLSKTPSFWHRHRVTIIIGAIVVVAITGVILEPTIAKWFEPDGYKVHVPL